MYTASTDSPAVRITVWAWPRLCEAGTSYTQSTDSPAVSDYRVNMSGYRGIHARDCMSPASRYTASIDLPG